MHPIVLAAAPAASSGRLVPAALAGIALIVVLITYFKVHPFLSLTLGSLLVGIGAGLPVADTVDAFVKGFGDTAAGVGALIAFGAMFGKLLADSGGADQIVDTIIGRTGRRFLPWAMALAGALIGLPMFFEIGLVLLVPVILLVARRAQMSIIAVGIPALAGLSAMHGLVPPHPGPLVAIDNLKADLGLTLALGIVVALPTIALSGPVFARFASRWVDVPAPELYVTGADERDAEDDAAVDLKSRRRPSFAVTLCTVLLPVVLMLGRAVADIALDEGGRVRTVLDNLGTPLVALIIAVVVAMFTFGRGSGMDRDAIASSLAGSLPPIAGPLLIVAAGGGFKQTLVDTGIGDLVADWVKDSDLSVLFLAWLVAVLIRLATGSATVATVTAAGILAPLSTTLDSSQTSLLVLAIGAGSLFFSHVNDAGFWLVKEYFGLSVGQNIRTWSLMETAISVCGLVFVLLLNLVV
ncbi:GntP family gluconate:H+ symporter [Actinomadura luteofluorescens]|uniref:GntP family gluconate:H+ symporter n=1 Tax=Actinomadura luteofluorescens TaxID=46163 RepID=A0A7Y9EC74_9ACTN|nr:gluconate:H+ symporter [Actinomadura luteofluorescens]NYD45079.1 GntP family gluconate:H+ symporter [Actinomadura luteofluorescens]